MKLSKQLRIFLLHARQDEEAVHLLYEQLIREGANVWLDRERLLPGQDWAYEIYKAIHRSDIVIVCLSKQFNQQGGYRHEEVRIALERVCSMEKDVTFIIPARLDECDLPEPLRRWQCVNLFEESGYQKLVSALKQQVALV